METLKLVGKGPGFVGVGALIVGGLIWLSHTGADVAALTGPLGAFVTAFYGAGFAKAAVDMWGAKKNGNAT